MSLAVHQQNCIYRRKIRVVRPSHANHRNIGGSRGKKSEGADFSSAVTVDAIAELLFHRLDWVFLSFIRKPNIPLKGILAPATGQQDNCSAEQGSGNETTADNCQRTMH
jgi:hypothetical protein